MLNLKEAERTQTFLSASLAFITALPTLFVFVGGMALLMLMHKQATDAIDQFNADVRPKLNKGCVEQTRLPYEKLTGRSAERGWLVTCGSNGIERQIELPADLNVPA